MISNVQLYNRILDLHGVVGVFVIKHQWLLNELMVSLQLVDVGLVSYDNVLKLLQLGHLVLQSASDLKGASANFLRGQHMQEDHHCNREAAFSPGHHLLWVWIWSVSLCYGSRSDLHSCLYPGSNEISLSSKLTSKPFMSMLAGHLLLEGTISLRN